MKVFARGASLRRRVAYSLAIVRLILVPVIFLAIYYLFAMASIVDQIVSVDAPVAGLAERISVEMMDARRAEQDYFLLHDPQDFLNSRQSLSHLQDIIGSIRDLQPQERATADKMLEQVRLYRQRLEGAATRMDGAGQPVQRLEAVVQAYERDLNQLLSRATRESRSRLIDKIHNQVGSFDAQVSATVEAHDPVLRQIGLDLRAASDDVLQLSSDLEKRSWERVQRDHQKARRLKHRAEWVLIVVSSLTLLVSVWASFVLPREVVRPLVELRAAVDHAVAGNYEIEFDVQGDGEVVQLANSVRSLIAHLRERKASFGLSGPS